MEALRRGQAIAEYDLNGHLISANDIFLALMNGSMAELEGMAHQDLCDPVFSFSEAYKVWWEHIRLGEVDEGTRRYVDLSGREIWLREVFNPIFGTDGRPFKVLHAALDVTRGRTAELQLIESMNYAGRIQQAMHEPSREALARHLRDRYGLVWSPVKRTVSSGSACLIALATARRVQCWPPSFCRWSTASFRRRTGTSIPQRCCSVSTVE
ncbi:MAG: PAS domain S-box protein [Betaproteobacteria bacterium]|nr:PAS domain S-box protein [Betaproteobacteria bacterium]